THRRLDRRRIPEPTLQSALPGSSGKTAARCAGARSRAGQRRWPGARSDAHRRAPSASGSTGGARMKYLEPEPFRLHVPDEVLDDLRDRLSRTRLPDEVPQSEWRYGTSLAYMRRLIPHWRDQFDWRAHEAALNAFDQFRVQLHGIDVHFIHQRGVGPRPMPLLLVHGWPGSVWEFHD